jgi:hypothetical protein
MLHSNLCCYCTPIKAKSQSELQRRLPPLSSHRLILAHRGLPRTLELAHYSSELIGHRIINRQVPVHRPIHS